ncbi:hypothetical protein QU3_3823 [Clostridioides difficile P42]|nr:hypothetical protein QU3_3823 [Clostridioides difficile P42]EQK84233.1 hypothetical protein QSM_3836 [Clostridioides difficile P30]
MLNILSIKKFKIVEEEYLKIMFIVIRDALLYLTYIDFLLS